MFGLNPADYLIRGAAPSLWWGARAIYNPDAKFSVQLIELLYDRQQITRRCIDPRHAPDNPCVYDGCSACEEECCEPNLFVREQRSLLSWINRRGLGKLRKELRRNYIGRDAQKLVWVRDGDFNLIADPRASHGYLYLAAWRDSACPAVTESSLSNQRA